MRLSRIFIVFLIASILVFGCGDDDNLNGVAYPKIRLLLAPGAQHADIERVVLSVSGPGMDVVEFELDIDDDGKTASGTISVPSGRDRLFTVTAYSADGVESTGEQRVDALEPGSEFLLEMQLKPSGNLPSDPITPSDVTPPDVETITGDDGALMALIPAGEFQMGDAFNEGWGSELPVHTVYVDAFYIDVYEVTNARYQKFMDETGHEAPWTWDYPDFNAPHQPVVGVYVNDAVAYAEWAGKRLPTEAEWEKAARGGLVGKRFPWGDEITHDDASYSGGDWGAATVGSFAPNSYGLYDMAGNVWEWCADRYDADYYSISPERNPTGPGSGTFRVLRGGSWNNSTNFLRVSNRLYALPSHAHNNVGFRCGMSRSD